MNDVRKEALEDAARACRKIAAGNYQVAAGDLPWWQSEESKAVWRIAAEKCSEAILVLVRELAHEKIATPAEMGAKNIKDEAGQLKCGEQGCDRAASHRYRWPGGSDAVVCRECLPYVKDKAGQMKLGLGCAFEFTPIIVDDPRLAAVLSETESIVAETLAIPVPETASYKVRADAGTRARNDVRSGASSVFSKS